ncbi:MAG TPA: NfuA family Fe-S biogenesis protein [Xanthomonadaceae bacterium]|nr:NfuA family Fe-S biogenesis protein [Xanthomonadaceae bacterium]
MLDISQNAQLHFRRLLESQGGDAVGIRITAVNPGTPRADCRLEFCEREELSGDEWQIECEGFSVFVPTDSVDFLASAEIDYVSEGANAQLTIRAPRLRGEAPDGDASLVERVRWVLDSEINPQLASHGGRVAVEQVGADGVVVLRFGGGCHGCGMVDVTLREGVERTLRERVPEITAVRDATDHDSGTDPYYRRQA